MMLRYIMELVETSDILGGTRRELFTIDGDAAEVERQMRRGGRGEMGSMYVQLLGVEILDDEPAEREGGV